MVIGVWIGIRVRVRVRSVKVQVWVRGRVHFWVRRVWVRDSMGAIFEKETAQPVPRGARISVGPGGVANLKDLGFHQVPGSVLRCSTMAVASSMVISGTCWG